ncbi:unnamed protein product [Penicillium bialowiezense]
MKTLKERLRGSKSSNDTESIRPLKKLEPNDSQEKAQQHGLDKLDLKQTRYSEFSRQIDAAFFSYVNSDDVDGFANLSLLGAKRS